MSGSSPTRKLVPLIKGLNAQLLNMPSPRSLERGLLGFTHYKEACGLVKRALKYFMISIPMCMCRHVSLSSHPSPWITDATSSTSIPHTDSRASHPREGTMGVTEYNPAFTLQGLKESDCHRLVNQGVVERGESKHDM